MIQNFHHAVLLTDVNFPPPVFFLCPVAPLLVEALEVYYVGVQYPRKLFISALVDEFFNGKKHFKTRPPVNMRILSRIMTLEYLLRGQQ